ncbi:transposase [Candidatus Nitrosotenuis uzonensis]|uniref:Transposase IS4-like domain-containing protein n=1 Tax=Candidatus Nitrosotenuis uzonensis TaxID=1407055 RepID=V6AV46_9ARCH|nr:transposase [Candidatus Nitrosotenuis uzonensis]CDI06455.1 hypothetical protein NITUZ_50002 [Candidatus Nitrosotenuis uzonensis]
MLVLRQYERKSYRRFVEFLQEAFGVGEFLGLSRLQHYTTLQKVAARLSHGQASYYYAKRFKLRRKFLKISVYVDMKRQIICGIKIRHRRRNDNIDFIPLLERAVRLVPVHTVVADRGYDSEQNHVATENLRIQDTIIHPRYEYLQCERPKDSTER